MTVALSEVANERPCLVRRPIVNQHDLVAVTYPVAAGGGQSRVQGANNVFLVEARHDDGQRDVRPGLIAGHLDPPEKYIGAWPFSRVRTGRVSEIARRARR